ncbi:zinc finger protein [Oryctes borbonicus]|uniref:Zinc finger protein n=1 Tax=Oryctes borbonicus TaxID=1629725 RepID=A0A0T6AWG5_9SCAR|nr:zinc finger protein [Oryctes borbonicus]
MDCGEFDTSKKLENLIKNVSLLLLPSPLWAIHIDPKYEYIVILHVQMINYEKVIIDKGILITYDRMQKCIKTTVLIHNEIISIPSLEYTIYTIADLSQLVYNLHQLTLCKNSNNPLEYPHCSKYVKIENYEKLCSTCNLTASDDFYEYTTIDNFNCNPQSTMEPILDSYIIDNTCIEAAKDELSETYNCSYCNEIFTTVNDLNAHIEFKCISIRNYEEVLNKDVNEVKLQENNISNIIECNECGKDLNSEEQLQENETSHISNRLYVCSICNKSTNRRSSHYKHVLSHQIKKPNLCNVCGKTFCRGYKMEDHILTHSEEKPYECSVCHRRYASRNNRRIHEETHKGNRPYPCKICNKTFTTPSNLNTHVKSVHNKMKPHQCGVCNMSFLYPQLLKIHMRKHTGEKPYKCGTCGRSFSKKIHLTVHNRVHTGEKPFICSMCGKGFTTTGNLSSHKKVHIKET